MSNIVINGNAENNALGWNGIQTNLFNGWTIGTNVPLTGNIYLFATQCAHCSISQNITLTAGLIYQASFWAMSSNGYSYQVSLSLGSNTLVTAPNLTQVYIQYSAIFTATTDLNTLILTGKTNPQTDYARVDGISIVQLQPTSQPTSRPTSQPFAHPSMQPSAQPNSYPTMQPSGQPSMQPSAQPSNHPSMQPSERPTAQPSGHPSGQPSAQPSEQPNSHPSMQPSEQPTVQPSRHPSAQPSDKPSAQPSMQPSDQPTSQPTSPTGQPSAVPTILPKEIEGSIDLAKLTHYQGMSVNGKAVLDKSGSSVSYAGDVNGDGFDDVIIGAPQALSTGAAYIIYGSYGHAIPLSVNLATSGNYAVTAIYGAISSGQCGAVVSSAGDYNKDGYADVIISCPSASFGGASAGAVYIIYGGKNLGSSINLGALQKSQGFVIYGANSGDFLGSSIASAGDINNDGYADILIGAPQASPNFKTNAGIVYALFGQANQNSIVLSNAAQLSQVTQFYGANAGDNFGFALSGWADSSKHNHSKLIISASGASDNDRITSGTSYVIFANFTSLIIDMADFGPSQGIKIFGANAGDNSGYTVGHVDGSTLMIGAPFASPFSRAGAGIIYVLADLKFTSNIDLFTENGIAKIYGASAGDNIGKAAASAGDINHDGHCDIIIGVPQDSYLSRNKNGISHIVYGTSPAKNYDLLQYTPSRELLIAGANSLDASGTSVSGAGDFNGDGFADIIIGAPGAKGKSGSSYILYGGYESPTSQPSSQPSMQPSEQPSAQPSRQPSSQPSSKPTEQPSAQPSRQPSSQPSSKPTEHGMKPSSYPTKQPFSHPSSQPTKQPSAQPSEQPTSQPVEHPTSVPSVMPSKAPFAISRHPIAHPTVKPSVHPSSQPSSHPSSQPSEQPSKQPSEQPSSKPTEQPTSQPTSPTAQPSSQPSEQPSHQPSEHPSEQPTSQPSRKPTDQPTSKPSSPTGQPTSVPTILAKEVDGITDFAKLTHYQGILVGGRASYDHNGYSVSYAGDINGDGFDDVIISAPPASPLSRTNAGSISIIYGSYGHATPSSINLANSGKYAVTTIYGANSGDQCGIVVSNAGDYNKDGYDDVIISCYLASPNSLNNAGAVYVIYGGKKLSSIIDLKNLQKSQGFVIYGANAGDSLGSSIASAGDINNDGFTDILMGAPQASPNARTSSGIVYALFGKADQDNIDLSNEVQQNQTTQIYGANPADFFGSSLGGGIDFNHDHHAEIIIGASAVSDNAKINSGTTYVIFGNFTSLTIDMANFDVSQGIKIFGAEAGDNSGYTVSHMGNSSLMIGSPFASPFARAGAGIIYILADLDFSSNIDLSTENGIAKVYGARAGDNIGKIAASAGDIHHDGHHDLIIGVPKDSYLSRYKCGVSHVVYGTSPAKDYDLLDYSSSRELLAAGATSLDASGAAVSSAGDFNGDGFVDTIFCAPDASPNLKTKSGLCYISFGGRSDPTSQPSSQPSLQPVLHPTSHPSAQPNSAPSVEPTSQPSSSPTIYHAKAAEPINSDTLIGTITGSAFISGIVLWFFQGVVWDVGKEYIYKPFMENVYDPYIKHTYELYIYNPVLAHIYTPCAEYISEPYAIYVSEPYAIYVHEPYMKYIGEPYAQYIRNPLVNLLFKKHNEVLPERALQDIEAGNNNEAESVISPVFQLKNNKVLPSSDSPVSETPSQTSPSVPLIADQDSESDEYASISSFSSSDESEPESAAIRVAQPIGLPTTPPGSEQKTERGHVLCSIMDMMDPEHVRLQDIEFARFIENLSGYNFLKQNQISFTSDSQAYTLNHLIPNKDVINALLVSTAANLGLSAQLMAVHYLNEQQKAVETPSAMQYCGVVLTAYMIPSLLNCAVAKFVSPRAECSIPSLSVQTIRAGIECYSFYEAANQIDKKESVANECKEAEIDYYYDLAGNLQWSFSGSEL